MFTKIEIELYRNYVERHQQVFSEPIVQSFFKDGEHVHLLIKMTTGSREGLDELNERFRAHFFEYRFIKYLVSTIRFTAIDLIRLFEKNDIRNPLIFDSPIANESAGGTIGEVLINKIDEAKSTDVISTPEALVDSFKNEQLIRAFSLLTDKQKLILTLYYGLSYKDHEIARSLSISPQAISKSRKASLHKLRLSMNIQRWETDNEK